MSHHTPSTAPETADKHEDGTTRRDFMVLTASALGVVGACAVAWPFVDSMNPSADVMALSSIEIDISSIPKGQTHTVMWRGRPVFVRHRTEKEIREHAESQARRYLSVLHHTPWSLVPCVLEGR